MNKNQTIFVIVLVAAVLVLAWHYGYGAERTSGQRTSAAGTPDKTLGAPIGR